MCSNDMPCLVNHDLKDYSEYCELNQVGYIAKVISAKLNQILSANM